MYYYDIETNKIADTYNFTIRSNDASTKEPVGAVGMNSVSHAMVLHAYSLKCV